MLVPWMPKEIRQVSTETGEIKVEVYSLAAFGGGHGASALTYLQNVRSGVAGVMSTNNSPESSPQGIGYYSGVQKFAEELAKRVADGLGAESPDAILELPSTLNFNAPYVTALLQRFPTTANLGGTIVRAHRVRSGETSSFADVLADTTASVGQDLSRIRILVMVDDIFAQGKTVGAAIVRLREAGLPVIARIVVATPLVVFGTP